MIPEAIATALAPLVVKHGEEAVVKILNALHKPCTVPAPPGWRCTRGEHADGPCAAVPDDAVQLVEGILRPVPWAGPATMGDDLMQEAWNLTNGDRHQAYGTAEDVFRAYGLIYTGFLAHKLKPGAVIDAADVALLMTGLKLAREANNPKRDNVVDAHGYLSLLARIRGWIVKATQ